MTYVYNSQLTEAHIAQDAFALYHKIQESPEPPTSILGGPALPALGHALAGSIGSAISNIAVFPLDLIITRLQVQRQLRKKSSTRDDAEYKDIQDACSKIYNQEGGLGAFYTGVGHDTAKTVIDSFLFFLAYNFLRQRKLQTRGNKSRALPVFEELNIGFIAGASAKLLTTPIANIVTRKQTAAMISARSTSSTASPGPSIKEIAKVIHAEKGIQGFWSGYSASLVLTLNPSITFFLFEFLKRTLLPRRRRDDPGAKATFLLAAIAKAVASSVTYPFSLAKARAQTSSRTVSNASSKVTESSQAPLNLKAKSSKSMRSAAESTVFSAILQIARDEGLGALYEGLAGEVLKGFFSHGITMIVKEAVHKLIIQLYYLILRALRRYPSPGELARAVADHAQDAASEAGEKIQHATSTNRH
ncbi:MAG: hypothetical protein M1837_001048 [Sclerophora amabilis]|nr:MAG: hypothetical protein M1837_001048 [Sclerophora amabilis]